MWILELFTIQSMLQPENKNHKEMDLCIIAAPDTVQSVALVGRLEIDHQKKTNISESTAPFPLKLVVCLEHMYTKVWNLWAPAV